MSKKTTAAAPSSVGRAIQIRVPSDNKEYTLHLGRELHKGGEGTIHEVTNGAGKTYASKVVKLYHDDKLTADHEAKLRVMVARPPVDNTLQTIGHVSIAWPEGMVYDNGRFVGYGMPYITGSWKLYDAYNPKRRAMANRPTNWGVLYDAARNMAIAIKALHSKRYIIGDVSHGNMLVNEKGLITLVDTDSFQVRESKTRVHFSPVATLEFTPPELIGKDLKITERHEYHDAYGLAVLIFQLLMEGHNPFQGDDPTSNESRPEMHRINSAQGIFPYDEAFGYRPPPGAPPFAMLPPNIQSLFRQAFVTAHKMPRYRPTPDQWIAELERSKSLLARCSRNANHVYSTHQAECPWCRREAKRGGTPGAKPSPKKGKTPKKGQTPKIGKAPAATTTAAKTTTTAAKTTTPTATPTTPPAGPSQTQPSGRTTAETVFIVVIILALIALVLWALAANGLI